ncbi:hypothetical protein T265_01357 [Opisthorchis viverrini]|uniref:Uncharacterized protein n=1 Tax=Opisthorchis viverrini TaxID=6198 RepID=A0A075AAB1_OPIVI|nr:hypothetical protein T265_01357 [Opisthorchis viverrini]KER32675.1 hypothetical protein T265_01357 [Opisthorchis viverrini]
MRNEIKRRKKKRDQNKEMFPPETRGTHPAHQQRVAVHRLKQCTRTVDVDRGAVQPLASDLCMDRIPDVGKFDKNPVQSGEYTGDAFLDYRPGTAEAQLTLPTKLDVFMKWPHYSVLLKSKSSGHSKACGSGQNGVVFNSPTLLEVHMRCTLLLPIPPHNPNESRWDNDEYRSDEVPKA